ncbi:MAG: hypothetical protein J6D54_09545 [Olsenella sp.]|nr:hypothetical protein [Olsenella sp.]
MDLIIATTHLIAELFRALRALAEFEDSARGRRGHTDARRPRHLRE